MRFELDGRGVPPDPLGRLAQSSRAGSGGASPGHDPAARRDSICAGRWTSRLTPAVERAVGVQDRPGRKAPTSRRSRSVSALNDQEDRVSFLPDDDLLVQLLPTDGLALPIDAAVEWTLERGWRFAGFGEAPSAVLVDREAPSGEKPADHRGRPRRAAESARWRARRGRHAAEHCASVRSRSTSDGSRYDRGDTNGATLNLSVTATVSLNIGPVRIAVSGSGVKGTLQLPTSSRASTTWSTSRSTVPMPTGLAVSVDADAISGGGFLQRIERAPAVRDLARRSRAAARRALRRRRVRRRRDRRRTRRGRCSRSSSCASRRRSR